MNCIQVSMSSILISFSVSAFAETPEKLVDREINHLLAYIGESDCAYIRNGDKHSPKEALKHIKRKYAHYADVIDSAEDFIRLSASQSSLTNKAYYIRCGEQAAVRSKVWLEQELNRYRQQSVQTRSP